MRALCRAVSPTLDRCQLSHREREPIDVARATRQHAEYLAALTSLGCEIVEVAPAPDLPDAVFIEDAAVVTDDIAILARPGAASRRAEVEAVAEVLAGLRPVRRIEPPGTLDGGDVLRVGRRVWVGRSQRTNAEGIDQLRHALGSAGYEVEAVPVTGCLHLKTAVTAVGPDTVLVNPEWVEPDRFPGFDVVEVDPAEPYAANALWVADTVLMPAAHPATRARLEERGRTVVVVDVSELAKAEAGVTCCSILLER